MRTYTPAWPASHTHERTEDWSQERQVLRERQLRAHDLPSRMRAVRFFHGRSFLLWQPAFAGYVRLVKNKKWLGLGAKLKGTRGTRETSPFYRIFMDPSEGHSARISMLNRRRPREHWCIIDIHVNDLARTQCYRRWDINEQLLVDAGLWRNEPRLSLNCFEIIKNAGFMTASLYPPFDLTVDMALLGLPEIFY